jgi:TolA-binding protein
MSMRPFAFGALLLLLASCSGQEIGQRYRAERDSWRANREFQRLSASARHTGEDRWRALADRYEEIAGRCLSGSGSGSRGSAAVQTELQGIAARALFSTAQIHGALQDSVRVDQIFRQMATTFSQQPNIAGEVSLSRGRIAESRGEIAQAIEYYRSIVEQVEPRPGQPGIAGTVLALPLRIARLQASASSDPSDSTQYAESRRYYRRMLAESASAKVVIGARGHLADIAADLGQWAEAERILRRLEQQLRSMDTPPRDPAEVRFATVMARVHAHSPPQAIRAEIDSLLADYPQGETAPRALLVLADEAGAQGRPDEALGFLDRLLREFDSAIVAPEAILAKGQILERLDRWSEAIDSYRSLQAEYPISVAALRTHLEIADHYLRSGNEAARMSALEQAQRGYREFLDRYPENPCTYDAWEMLIRTLSLEHRQEEAVNEMVTLSEYVAGSSRELRLLVEAARMATVELGDTSRAVALLERAATRFPQTRTGAWSSREAERLRRGAMR